jgi:hypothetical protein
MALDTGIFPSESVSMPILHVVDSSNRLVITTYTGDVSREEVVARLKELRDRHDFQPDFSQLTDLTQVSKLNLDFHDMEAIYHSYDPFSHEAKRAVVAPANSATFGLARVYQSLVEPAQFEVFHSLLEAISWLGLEATTVTDAIRRTHAKGGVGT